MVRNCKLPRYISKELLTFVIIHENKLKPIGDVDTDNLKKLIRLFCKAVWKVQIPYTPTSVPMLESLIPAKIHGISNPAVIKKYSRRPRHLPAIYRNKTEIAKVKR